MINIFLVDDHDIVRFGIRSLLDKEKDIKVVGEADNGEDAVKQCRALEPDMVLMDLDMPGLGGMEATKRILHHCPDTRVLFLSMHKDNALPAKVMETGAWGYITKDAGPQQMLQAIFKVHSGQKFLTPEMAQQIAISRCGGDSQNPFEKLSQREMEIMLMLTRGERVLDIAAKFNVTPKTVNTHRYRMFDKLGVSGDVELTRLAIKHNVISSDI
ncbi:Chemotaxis response regulator protein-glutamate methylesterase of group 3 operon [Saliniradius amylolyticus]|uniref:Chemotaxis response regulator protein-glutamate methylesterase of group 3 operon n=1 Tax=Saliniradius amylolyticus TaxID=2183582 RepID=A0A2S2E261_9ALTE|nr:UvrY/SirA/GacA family response regulator transcription factor [Saliniradius amylolyticus]AWL11731.1 Chemotaxis response regulator protein-glutamate methylesterase of group 3 operon [Saliniradius amylolyticus]